MMTKITLEVPDELAGRIYQLQDQLPRLLSIAVDLLEFSNASFVQSVNSPVISEIIDFLAKRPSPLESLHSKSRRMRRCAWKNY